MSYFSPYIDETGIHIPTYNDILAKRIEDAKSIYGQDIYLGNDSADYQAIAVESLAIYDAMQAIQLAYNQMSPATSIGVGLSNLVQLNGIKRLVASYSTCDVTLRGTTSVTITNGVVQDVSGKKWSLPASVTLQAAGSPIGEYYELTVTATCQEIGAINALAGDIDTIVTPTSGWTSVTNASSAIAGQAVEADSDLRNRQAISAALPSQTMLAGTIAAIATLENVTRYQVYENATNSTTYGDPGVPFEGAPAHSITCIVEGGEIADIADAIYHNRGLGCYTNGDVITTITDPTYGTSTDIRFYRPEYVNVYVAMMVKKLSGWVSSDEDIIKKAVSDYINSLGISKDLYLSSIICAAFDANANKTKPTFSIALTIMGTDPSSPPMSTADIVVGYNEVVLGSVDNITIVLV